MHTVKKMSVNSRVFTWRELSQLNRPHNAHVAYRGKVSRFYSSSLRNVQCLALHTGRKLNFLYLHIGKSNFRSGRRTEHISCRVSITCPEIWAMLRKCCRKYALSCVFLVSGNFTFVLVSVCICFYVTSAGQLE